MGPGASLPSNNDVSLKTQRPHTLKGSLFEACLLTCTDLGPRSAVLLGQHYGHAGQELIPRRLHLHRELVLQVGG